MHIALAGWLLNTRAAPQAPLQATSRRSPAARERGHDQPVRQLKRAHLRRSGSQQQIQVLDGSRKRCFKCKFAAPAEGNSIGASSSLDIPKRTTKGQNSGLSAGADTAVVCASSLSLKRGPTKQKLSQMFAA